MSEIRINNLSEYIQSVAQEKANINKKHNSSLQNTRGLFYRGHSDVSYQLEPSAYRVKDGKSYREVEHHLYQEMLRYEEPIFAKDEGILKKLARMQHHGLPTRLLDVTENPTVALFFACIDEENLDKDGQVILFDIHPNSTLFSSTIPPSSFVGLEMPISVVQIAERVFELFFNYLKKRMDERSKVSDFDLAFHKLMEDIIEKENPLNFGSKENMDLFITSLQYIETSFEVFFKEWDLKLIEIGETLKHTNLSEEIIKNLNEQIVLVKLKNDITDYKKLIITRCYEDIRIPYENNGNSLCVFLAHFLNFYFVYAPINNERIRRQEGAFLIFPAVKSEIYNPSVFLQTTIFTINKDAKQNILQQLSDLGITQNYLFPSLDERAKELKKQYPQT